MSRYKTAENEYLQDDEKNGISTVESSKYDAISKSKQLNSDSDNELPYEANGDANYEYEKCDDDNNENTPNTQTSFSFLSLPRQQKKILCSIFSAYFLSFMSLSLLAPFFPEEALIKDVNNTISGWIFGIFALSQVILSPIFGKILPHIGMKFMYVSGMFLSGGCTLLFGAVAYVPVDDGPLVFILLCFLLRVFLSIGCTALNTACFAMCAKEFPDNIATVFGIGEIFSGVGYMTGPAIGGVLYGAGGFFVPFLVMGLLLLLFVPIGRLIIPEDTHITQTESNTSSWILLRSPSLIVVSLAIVIASFVWAVLGPTLEPHLRDFDLGPELIGVLFLLMSAFYAIASPFWGWVADKCSDSRILLIPGFFFCACGMFLLGPSQLIGFDSDFHELWLDIVALIILGIAGSLALIPTFDILFTVAGRLGFEDDLNTYGLVAGIWGSMYALGDFIGPAIGGTLLDNVGFQWCCNITSFSCLFMIPLVAIEYLCTRRKPGKERVSLTNKDEKQEDRKPLLSDV